jgi:hypothetical protein
MNVVIVCNQEKLTINITRADQKYSKTRIQCIENKSPLKDHSDPSANW